MTTVAELLVGSLAEHAGDLRDERASRGPQRRATLSIAYDYIRGSRKPASWDVLAVAAAIGLTGVAESFLPYLAHEVVGLDLAAGPTPINLRLSVSIT